MQVKVPISPDRTIRRRPRMVVQTYSMENDVDDTQKWPEDSGDEARAVMDLFHVVVHSARESGLAVMDSQMTLMLIFFSSYSL